MIQYDCKHCHQKIGTVPIEKMSEVLYTLRQLQLSSHHMQMTADGRWVVYCICEQCEQCLVENPHYYTVEKWLQ